MNRANKAHKPAKKNQKSLNKAPKRAKSTSAKKSVASAPLTSSFNNNINNNKIGHLLSTSQRSFTTRLPMKSMKAFGAVTPPSQPQFQLQPLNFTSFFPQSARFAPFNMAKRNLILKPKAPLDPEVDLLFEFNILKDAKPITELPDAEYPAWLWNIADTQQSLYDISKIPQDEMTIPTMRRKFKLERRDLIRNNNNSSRK